MRYTDYYYKGYDITNKNKLEKLKYEYTNPYGYNIDSNERRVKNEINRTNQDELYKKNNVEKHE